MRDMGKQSQVVQRFLKRAIAQGIEDGAPVTRIQLVEKGRTLLNIDLGKYDKGQAAMDDMVKHIMDVAKDDCPLGKICYYYVRAHFGSNPVHGLETRFEIWNEDETAEETDMVGEKYPPNGQGLTGVGLKFIHSFATELVKGNDRQRNRDAAYIERLETRIDEQNALIKKYQDAAYVAEEEKQKRLNQEAERERLKEKEARDYAVQLRLVEGAEIALGAILPMIAGGSRSPKQLNPGVKKAIDWSLKNFANSLKENQVKEISNAFDKDYLGELVDINCFDPNALTPGPRKFLILLAMSTKGMLAPPPEDEIFRFLDYLLDNVDKQHTVLNALDPAQRLFMTAHLRSRHEMRNADEQESAQAN